MYIGDSGNLRVRKVTISSGIIATIAGTGSTSYTGDGGAATSATFQTPGGLAIDASGNVYVVDIQNNRIRKVTISTGIITTFAGSDGKSYSGDGGEAPSATLNSPTDISLDSADNVYIADMSNSVVRKVTVSAGIISTVAGTGSDGDSGDGGNALNATFSGIYAIALDSADNIYIADSYNNLIRKVTVSTDIVSTIAGSSTSGSYSGDGVQATSVYLNNPQGLALDSAGKQPSCFHFVR